MVQPLGRLCQVDERINVLLVSLEIFMFNEPLDLFLDHFLLRDEHVLEDFHQFCLQRRVRYLFTHFHDFHDGFLQRKINKVSRRLF